MKRRSLLLCTLAVFGFMAAHGLAAEKVNVVLILADDLGHGDVQCYNPERGKIPTPHLDALARAGMRFTDAHTSSGVCSPTRYSLLTGRYHWRTRLQSGIVNPWEQPLIAPDRLTLAGLLKQHGYRTAAIGKWHLGWDWPIAEAQRPFFAAKPWYHVPAMTDAHGAAWKAVFSQPIGGGPVAHGFDSYFGTDVPNWPPYCFLENDRTVGIPSVMSSAELRSKGASLSGPALPDWKLEGVLPGLTERAVKFIDNSARHAPPFFLYLPLTSPHTPIAVNAEWQGRSGLGSNYADFVMETDAAVGRVLAALEASGAAKDTLVIFTSDNGCSYLAAQVKNLEAAGHFPSAALRGYKADVWEGGHRVPFIVRWPGEVAAGSTCAALVQQCDLMATLADILKTPLPPQSGEDSVSLLPLLKGGAAPVREHAISTGLNGLASLRQGQWKIIFGQGGGGFGAKADPQPTGQLYDLAADPAETTNLWEQKPALVAELTATMQRLVASQKNDVPVPWQRFLQR